MRPITKLVPVFALIILSTSLITQQAQAASIRTLPNLATVTFLERTGTVGPEDTKTFSYDSAALTTRLSDPLAQFNPSPNYDFYGAQLYTPTGTGNYSEVYDVFYSDALGNFDINGEYVTIEAVWPRYQGLTPYDPGNVGGGLNISAVYLSFSDKPDVYANSTPSWVAFGDNRVVGSELWATDGDINTFTTMGNTIQPGHPERLRITVGFSSLPEPPVSSPEPGTLILLGCGLAGLVGYGRGKLKKSSS